MLLAALSVGLMVLDHQTRYGQHLRASLVVLVYPLQYAVTVPGDLGRRVADEFTTRSRLERDNETLRTQNRLLRAQLQKYAELEAENIRLRELLQSARKMGERVLVAELLSVDLDPYRRMVKINKGSRHGVYLGQPLVDADGIMGQVVRVHPLDSVAMLITDPDHTLPVQVNRNGLRALAVGTGTGLKIPYQPNNADIRPGDLLVTSGLGGVFPAGYPAAVVESVETNPALQFATITARPAARLDRGREVLLVWPAGTAPAAARAEVPP